MCGFTGFLDKDVSYDRASVIKRMNDLIAHRGPDDEEYYSDEKYYVGFRRLSIIDIDGGRQPMTNEDDTLTLVYNGEIYNYRKVREELVSRGHVFKTNSDSEVLLHGYEEWGEAMFGRLRGMFAFVIYDNVSGVVFGARDFFGIKPLHYAVMDGAFIFGSEIKSILEHPKCSKVLNERALENYMSFQYAPGPETFFEGIYKLDPAHWFRFSIGMDAPETGRYWIPEFNEDTGKSLDYWVDEIEKAFDDSVEAHKISDVEVGSFLSSGVDSSYVACSAHVDKTFTVGFDAGSHYNETDYAKELSELIPVKNISHIISPEEYWENFPRIQWHMDEPLADPSAVALYFVSREAAKYLKVVLSGEGADEIFGGYNIYREPLEMPAYDKIPFPIRRAAGRIASSLKPRRGLNFVVRRGKKLEDRFIGNAYIFTAEERGRLLKKSGLAPSPSEVVAPWYGMVSEKDPVTKMQFVDLNGWMVGDILLKADRMSMANSLELRVPFLDKEIMSLAGKLPLEYRVNRENTKYAMRLAARRRMPSKWANKRKLGFPVPTRVWLKDEKYVGIIRDAFKSETAEKFFHADRILKLVDDHVANEADNGRKIWTVYTFIVWYGIYFPEDVG
ncbi:MAG: asparagine synthase (glutamine-hydrolyzing) [Clostridiales Family XIII bacterium]|jgi:asparagine synthase (glutamine-hydrolysing)|nr:asparagine synthase (glutamine-hydrolyzing) [Clostridiales Family XIII bacterium]